MSRYKILIALILCTAAGLVFAAKKELSLDLSKTNFEQQRALILSQINKSSDYKELSVEDRKIIIEALEEMAQQKAAMQGNDSQSEALLVETAKKINTALARGYADSQKTCETVSGIGSNMKRKTCKTVAEKRREYERTQQQNSGSIKASL